MKAIELIVLSITVIYTSQVFGDAKNLLKNSSMVGPSLYTVNSSGVTSQEMRIISHSDNNTYDIIRKTDLSGKSILIAAKSDRVILSFKEKIENKKIIEELLAKHNASLIKCMRPKSMENTICLADTKNWIRSKIEENMGKLKSENSVRNVSREWLAKP